MTTATKNATRPYTAIHISYVGQAIKTLNMTAKCDFTIAGTNGGFVTISKGERFTAVRSDSLGEDTWYIVRHMSGVKKCSCPAMKPCKHERAANIRKPVCPLIPSSVEMNLPEPNPLYGIKRVSPFARPDGLPDVFPPSHEQIMEIRNLDTQLGHPTRDLSYKNSVEANLILHSLKAAIPQAPKI